MTLLTFQALAVLLALTLVVWLLFVNPLLLIGLIGLAFVAAMVYLMSQGWLDPYDPDKEG